MEVEGAAVLFGIGAMLRIEMLVLLDGGVLRWGWWLG